LPLWLISRNGWIKTLGRPSRIESRTFGCQAEANHLGVLATFSADKIFPTRQPIDPILS
jgi:hypothetical protein